MGKYRFEAPIDGILSTGVHYEDHDNSVSKSQHSIFKTLTSAPES